MGVKVTELTSLMVFKFTLASQQSCKVYLAAEGIGGEKTIKCDVNGTTFKFKAYSYGEVEVGNFTCPVGQNTITIMPSYT